MKIRVTCPACNDTLEIDAEHVGQQAECGSCLQPFLVEDPNAPKPKKYKMRRSESDESEAEAKPAAKPASGDKGQPWKRREDHHEDDRDDDDYEERPRRRRRRDDDDYEPRKSRLVYILLALFVGGLGVHNFYAGRTNIGIAQLMIWILSWPLMFVFIGCITIFIPGLWALIDIVTVDRDGDGRRME